MHVVIGGFGRVGRYLAHMLEEDGHTVAIIDRNQAAFDEYGEDLKGRKITGEVFDRETLLRAGIEHADAFAAVTSGDNSNVVAARVARERFAVPTVVARIFDPRRAVIYQRFGIPTISSVQWSVGRLFQLIVKPDLRAERVFGGGEVVVVEAKVPGQFVGQPVAALAKDGAYSVTTLVRNGVAVLPDSLTLEATDRLYLTARRETLDELREHFGLE
jgi:trk system potassium uptake protein TrkA